MNIGSSGFLQTTCETVTVEIGEKMNLPLEKIDVLDLTQAAAGPFCGMLLVFILNK